MRAIINNKIAKLILWTICILFMSGQVMAENEKYKARLSVDYIKIMNDRTFLSIDAKYKFEKKYNPATELQLFIYEEINDSLLFKGEALTDMEGHAEFPIIMESSLSDSILTFKYIVKIEDNEGFKDAEKSVKFLDGNIFAEAIVVDSINYIAATFSNANGEGVEGEKLKLLLHRLFAPLTIGESSYKTDDDGKIVIALEDTMPGIDGILTFEVMLDSRKYGIVKTIFEAPIGKIIVDESTFDKRTMWSPPSKTPIFLWIFPNIIILGIWIIIGLLIFNLIKIYKS